MRRKGEEGGRERNIKREEEEDRHNTIINILND